MTQLVARQCGHGRTRRVNTRTPRPPARACPFRGPSTSPPTRRRRAPPAPRCSRHVEPHAGADRSRRRDGSRTAPPPRAATGTGPPPSPTRRPNAAPTAPADVRVQRVTIHHPEPHPPRLLAQPGHPHRRRHLQQRGLRPRHRRPRRPRSPGLRQRHLYRPPTPHSVAGHCDRRGGHRRQRRPAPPPAWSPTFAPTTPRRPGCTPPPVPPPAPRPPHTPSPSPPTPRRSPRSRHPTTAPPRTPTPQPATAQQPQRRRDTTLLPISPNTRTGRRVITPDPRGVPSPYPNTRSGCQAVRSTPCSFGSRQCYGPRANSNRRKGEPWRTASCTSSRGALRSSTRRRSPRCIPPTVSRRARSSTRPARRRAAGRSWRSTSRRTSWEQFRDGTLMPKMQAGIDGRLRGAAAGDGRRSRQRAAVATAAPRRGRPGAT